MNANGKKHIILLLLAVAVFTIIITEAFKVMDLSIKDYPKFKYRGGKNTKADWYAYATPLAKAVGKEFGIPWRAIVAQSAIETGWGKSSLLSKYNNWGGIKDTDGKNTTAPVATTEYINGQKVTIKDGFEVYPTPYEGLRGYAMFIHKNKRYAEALKYPNDPYQYIVELKKAGYATDPNYVAKVHSLINEKFA